MSASYSKYIQFIQIKKKGKNNLIYIYIFYDKGSNFEFSLHKKIVVGL